MSKRDEIDMLTRRVTQLEAELAQLTQMLAAAEPLLRNTNHLTDLAEQANHLNQAAQSTLRDLREQAAPLGIGKVRFEVALNTVYHADTPGYVSMVFVGGRTGLVQILAGPTDPPTQPVSFPGGEYVSGFIRRGEYWMASCLGRGLAAFKGIFTPSY